MEVNSFQILLVDVTFYLYHIQNVVRNVLKKIKTRIYAAPAVKWLTVVYPLSTTIACFWSVLLALQITVIGKKMSVQT